MKLHLITVKTPIGGFRMITENNGSNDVVRASGFASREKVIKRLPEQLQQAGIEDYAERHPYEKAVKAYFSGNKTALKTILYKQNGAPFTQKAWDAMSTIEYGRVLSYKELANAAGNPAAVRAAGTACGANHLILLVPCHRVVKTGGGMGNFADGTDVKEHLLKLEGALE